MKFKSSLDSEDIFGFAFTSFAIVLVASGLGKAIYENEVKGSNSLEQVHPIIEMALTNQEGVYFSQSGWWIYYDMGTKKMPLDQNMYDYSQRRLKEIKDKKDEFEIEQAKKFALEHK